MLESLWQGLQIAWSPQVLSMVLLAVPIGLVVGVIPGIGGVTALTIMLPYIYGMDLHAGLAFLLALHAVVYTGGGLTAIVLGVPGAPPNAATIMDGHPMTLQGRGAEAMGAALCASLIGGLIGMLALLALIPVLQPLVLSFGSPEIFLFSVLGICFISVLGGSSKSKGLLAGGLGFCLALIGYENITGEARFVLGSDYLLGGIQLLPLLLGLFSIPEIVDLAVNKSGSKNQPMKEARFAAIAAGMKQVLQRPWLVFKSSLIGVVVGIIPGVGGETAPFVAYASARAASDDPETFGTGSIEGVIAPESSNNAKEGGAMVPTLALGIPGSVGMTVLLAGFLILGADPGPAFLVDFPEIAYALVIVLAEANVLAVLMLLPAIVLFVRIADIDRAILTPCLLILVIIGVYSVRQDVLDILLMILFGGLGILMKKLDYNRPSLLLGFILGPALETYYHITLQIHGLSFVFRPMSMGLIVVMVGLFVMPTVLRLWKAK